jgi:hypothetical protein
LKTTQFNLCKTREKFSQFFPSLLLGGKKEKKYLLPASLYSLGK